MFGLPLAFALPAILIGLIVLPLIWWLLRLTPPKPNSEIFPPLRLLQLVIKHDETPARSPWWLTLLRLILAALLILALAKPLLNPQAEMALDDGPLLIMIDNSWGAAADWDARQRTAAALITQAREQGKSVAISTSVAAPTTSVILTDAQTAAARFASLQTIAAHPNRVDAVARLIEASRESTNATLAILSDGLTQSGDDQALQTIAGTSITKVLLFNGEISKLVAINAANNRSDALEISLIRASGSDENNDVTLNAVDEKGRLLASASAVFEDGAATSQAAFEVPFELRNDMANIRIENQKNAASIFLLDENNRRRRFALFSGLAGDEAQPLLSPLYYIRRAIAPYADIVEPRTSDLAVDLPEIIAQGPAVIVLADIGVLPNSAEEALADWIASGGTLVRFAGPRLAISAEDDPFLPVRLRAGERALGGALTWTEPQVVAPFSPDSPFAQLSAPKDVFVNRQILAEPDPDLAKNTWASLADGTPLVTGKRLGKGSIVLFHVTAEATWSNLPISGSFVDMLRRIADLSSNTGAAQVTKNEVAAETLSPLRIVRGDGELIAPPSFVKPLSINAQAKTSFENPAGLYGVPDAFKALNLLKGEDTLAPFELPSLNIPTQTLPYTAARQIDLSGWLFALALACLIIDTIAMLWINGRLKGLFKNKRQWAGATALVLFALIALPNNANAQDTKNGDAAIIESLQATRIGYVLTGVRSTDDISKAGLFGLSKYLASRTAFEPADPVGLDIERDELSLYPLIYFPMDAKSDMPSDAAIARLDAYMQNGGSILFDTRDEIAGSLSAGQGAENQRLRAIMRSLNVPALEPVPEDHVLTKAFYILNNFPGLYASSPLWVQKSTESTQDSRPIKRGDGVSPLLITGNDFASAWALDEAGRPLIPIASGDPSQRIMAFRAGVNIMMYMLTGNYKADQVHIPALLERLGQ